MRQSDTDMIRISASHTFSCIENNIFMAQKGIGLQAPATQGMRGGSASPQLSFPQVPHLWHIQCALGVSLGQLLSRCLKQLLKDANNFKVRLWKTLKIQD